ncbi:hypothetical protein CICLE_v10023738mg, partial [Citrus x clementina]
IPFADFLNHDGLSEAVVLHDEDKQLSEVIADRDYAPKEEVWITYGKFPNSTLLLDFGFSLPYNIYDEVSFEFQLCWFLFAKGMVIIQTRWFCLQAILIYQYYMVPIYFIKSKWFFGPCFS